MFNIDHYKFLLQLIPAFLRTPKLVAFYDCMQQEVRNIFGRFKVYRGGVLYNLDHNGQVYSIENVLNDYFDSDDRTIYITDGFAKERFYVFTRSEDKPKFLKKYIYSRADYADTGVDFIVWVPFALTLNAYDILTLNALVNNYKLASKRYKIYRV